ncbi:hypothetical protein H4W30_002491 [Amycolatopsis roodepoortensis]|uniref:Uncharacterized protein n=1 Tax=Amycolatopsis roodepoortensis TaxID=700274 RepID=A0ABR9L3Z0_9PSEU|nr:hypothetical protein [Amycolatopsis roodepoortensis]
MTTTVCKNSMRRHSKRRTPFWPTKSRANRSQDPEPVQLYSLLTLYLAVHAPFPDTDPLHGRCSCCGQVWPCVSVRLAYRLREGF